MAGMELQAVLKAVVGAGLSAADRKAAVRRAIEVAMLGEAAVRAKDCEMASEPAQGVCGAFEQVLDAVGQAAGSCGRPSVSEARRLL